MEGVALCLLFHVVTTSATCIDRKRNPSNGGGSSRGSRYATVEEDSNLSLTHWVRKAMPTFIGRTLSTLAPATETASPTLPKPPLPDIMYTRSELNAIASEPSSSVVSSNHALFVSGIIGGIVGGLIAVLVVVLSALLLRRFANWTGRRDRTHFQSHSCVRERSMHEQNPQDPESLPERVSIRTRDSNSASSLLPSSTGQSSLASNDRTPITPYRDPDSPRCSTTPLEPSRSPTQSLLTPVELGFTVVPASPPSHSIDVPYPAISVTSTEVSLRHADLIGQIETLEAKIQKLRHPGSITSPSPEGQQRKREQLRTLKQEIAELRVRLVKERQLVTEATPRRARRGRRLAVVV
ncbi:hypothetical protein BD414DRAFT_579392 [Trametes punicea]|nr:hypothetical protein BD414DRAFT_579392 [Trametes punicea]